MLQCYQGQHNFYYARMEGQHLQSAKRGTGTVSNAHEVDGNNGAVCGVLKQGLVLHTNGQL